MLTLSKKQVFKLGSITLVALAISGHSCFQALCMDAPKEFQNGKIPSYSVLKCGMKIPGYINPQEVPREVTPESIPQVFTNPEAIYVKNMDVSEMKLRIYRMWDTFMFAHEFIGFRWPIHYETFNALFRAIKIVTQTTYNEGRVEKPNPDFRKRKMLILDGPITEQDNYLPDPSSGEEAWNYSFKSPNFSQNWMPGGPSFKKVENEPEEYWRRMSSFLITKIYIFKLLIIQIINKTPDLEGEITPQIYKRVCNMLNWQPWEKID